MKGVEKLAHAHSNYKEITKTSDNRSFDITFISALRTRIPIKDFQVAYVNVIVFL